MEKNSRKVISRGAKGITLIALVITIVVMLILASVTISLVIDTNLIETLAAAKEPNEIEGIKERLQLVKGSMYIDNKGKSSIETYFASLDKEKIEPYVVTKSEKFTEYLGVVEVNNKYSFLIRFENNIEIEYEGKIEEIDRKEQIIEIKISGDNTQANFPIMLAAELTNEGQKVTSGKWILNKKSESIGIEDELYEENIANEENINLKLEETGEYYLHVLVTDKYGRKKETIKGPITVGEKYHEHTGNATSGGGCFTITNTTPIYANCTHIFGGAQWNGSSYKYYYYTDTRSGATLWECSLGNYWDNGGHGSDEGSNFVHQLQTGTRVTGYSAGCGKNGSTIEGYNITY